MTNLYTMLLSVIAVVGLIALIAMGKITWGDGGPLIAAIVGVHGGAIVSQNTTGTQSTAVGSGALNNATGSPNKAVGFAAPTSSNKPPFPPAP